MKKAQKLEIGKRVAEQSEGRIVLAIEDSVAILRGQFTSKERKPLRFKKGAGWRYSVVDGVETWKLSLPKAKAGKPESAAEPAIESAAEPSEKPAEEPSLIGAVYVRWNGESAEAFTVARESASSLWLVGGDGTEKRKQRPESPERLKGGFVKVA